MSTPICSHRCKPFAVVARHGITRVNPDARYLQFQVASVSSFLRHRRHNAGSANNEMPPGMPSRELCVFCAPLRLRGKISIGPTRPGPIASRTTELNGMAWRTIDGGSRAVVPILYALPYQYLRRQ
ncbi:hypothetical protein KCP75_10390 [Salmonella enterica subsp. enterica]|nr:hypothetical protein KCP75_10390 [Salmonella enterica subsp. enterica]